MRSRRAELGVAALAVAAAVVAAVLALTVFRHGSVNNDDGVYLLAAHTLRHGHLFASQGPFAPADIPWFGTAHDGHYVLKYLPTVPAYLALSLLATGQIWPALALVAGALPVVVYALARTVGLTPPQGLLAAALVALSPLTLIESGQSLSYVPFTVLIGVVWLLAFRLLQRGSGWLSFLLGVLLVACGSIRPYDTLLLGLPFAVALLRRADLPRLRLAAGTVAGAVGPLVAIALYDTAATGQVTKLPFSSFEPSDAVGFGGHRLFPEDTVHTFGIASALAGSALHFFGEPATWYAVGVALLPAAVLAVRPVLREGSRVALLLAAAGTFLVGYFVFWGPYNASVTWGGTKVVGPFYALVLLPPIAIAAVWWAVRLPRRSMLLLTPVLLGGLFLSGWQLDHALGINSRFGDRTAAVLDAAAAVGQRDLLVVQALPAYLGHPVSDLNGLSGPTLLLGSRLDPTAVPANRPVTMLLLASNLYNVPRPQAFALVPQRRVSGRTLTLDVAGPRSAPGGLTVVATPSESTTCASDAPITLAVTRAGVRVDCLHRHPSTRPDPVLRPPCPTAVCVGLAAFETTAHGGYRRLSTRRIVVGTRGADLLAFVDRDAARLDGFPSVTASAS